MRIGVDASCWANGRGYGRFTRELLRAMSALAPDDEFVCFLDPAAQSRFDLQAPNVTRIAVAQHAAPTEAASAEGARGPADILRFTAAVWQESLDVFFSPTVYTYFPLPPRLRSVVTIHDAIVERFPGLTLPTLRARLFWSAKVACALMQARLVLTVSEHAAREIEAALGVPRSMLRIAVEAPAAAYAPSSPEQIAGAAARAGLPAGATWFTYVGGFSPHKRVEDLVRAHGSVVRAQGHRPSHLLLVGARQGDVFLGSQAAIHDAIAAAGTTSLVHWAGFVPDEELRHLHSGALALVLPSMAEGFGLPAVEAAACGCPVIATSASPLPELLAGGGVFIEPGDVRALTQAMQRLATDECAVRELGAVARQRAGLLTWDRAATAALGALREAAA